MPRLKSAFFVWLLLAAAPAFATGGDVPPPPPPPPVVAPTPTEAAAAQLFSDPIEREAFIALMAADQTKALANAVLAAETAAQASGGADPVKVAAAINADPSAAKWRQQVVKALGDSRAALAKGQALPTPPTDYPDTPLIGKLVKDKTLNLQGPADLYAKINNPKYGGSTAQAAGPAPCAVNGARASLDAAAASGGAGLTSVTGDCGGGGTAAAVVAAPVDTSKHAAPTLTAAAGVDLDGKTPPTPTTESDKHKPGDDADAGSNKSGFFGGMFGKVKDYFKTAPLNQMLAGVGFGAAFGMLLCFGGPVGVIGGALLGGVIGGLLGSGIIGHLMGTGGTGGS